MDQREGNKDGLTKLEQTNQIVYHEVNPEEFDREMTLVYLQLKGEFTPKTIASLMEELGVTEDMLHPSCSVDSGKLPTMEELKLPNYKVKFPEKEPEKVESLAVEELKSPSHKVRLPEKEPEKVESLAIEKLKSPSRKVKLPKKVPREVKSLAVEKLMSPNYKAKLPEKRLEKVKSLAVEELKSSSYIVKLPEKGLREVEPLAVEKLKSPSHKVKLPEKEPEKVKLLAVEELKSPSHKVKLPEKELKKVELLAVEELRSPSYITKMSGMHSGKMAITKIRKVSLYRVPLPDKTFSRLESDKVPIRSLHALEKRENQRDFVKENNGLMVIDTPDVLADWETLGGPDAVMNDLCNLT